MHDSLWQPARAAGQRVPGGFDGRGIAAFTQSPDLLQLRLRQEIIDLRLGQLLCASQARTETAKQFSAAELLAQPRHQLEPARVEVSRCVELFERRERR